MLLNNQGPLVGRGQALSFTGSFHGRHCGALACSHSKFIHKKYINTFMWTTLPYPETITEEVHLLDNVNEILSQKNIFAVIIEPIQCEGGDRMASDVFYDMLRKLCLSHDVPMIVDEIQTGIGATGKFWAHEFWNTKEEPDLITFGKKSRQCGVLFPEKYSEMFEPHQIFNTWCGHPIDLIVGQKILSKITPEVLNNVEANGLLFKNIFDKENK